MSIRTSHHHLDWTNKPRAFKVYTKISSIPLPHDFPRPRLGALASVGGVGPPDRATTINIETLTELLFFTGGITREMGFPGGAYYMRAAPATGALYPIELYIVCQGFEGLGAGIYHFGPGDFSLTELRKGDYRTELSLASGRNQEIATSPVTIAMTSLAWRNAWKYQARSYRHWFWDSGVMAANLLATAVSAGLSSKLVMSFDDARVNLLLGLEEGKEATVALAPIGAGLVAPPREQTRSQSKLNLETVPLSAKEVQYPEVWRVHASSSLDERGASDWIKAGLAYHGKTNSSGGSHYPLQLSDVDGVKDTLEEVILRRGSTRRFATKSISFSALSAILYSSSRGVPFDFLRPGVTLIETYLIANSVDGLPPGAYSYIRDAGTLVQLKAGSFRRLSGYLCLEQPLFSDASVVLFLMADLQTILKHLGNRGYRAAQFEAGVVLGKIYLSAYAQRLGASGSTFYDDAVTDFFSPHAANMNAMVAVGIGVPDYVAREGKILVGTLNKAQLMK
ncbi:MAG: SagB/ThcOx family dehydrogenase [Thaumarchaeota archaeon]|nr:SagB/ThcOx family dehydrogenase [Nitrososphaerota archaeon]